MSTLAFDWQIGSIPSMIEGEASAFFCVIAEIRAGAPSRLLHSMTLLLTVIWLLALYGLVPYFFTFKTCSNLKITWPTMRTSTLRAYIIGMCTVLLWLLLFRPWSIWSIPSYSFLWCTRTPIPLLYLTLIPFLCLFSFSLEFWNSTKSFSTIGHA